MSRYTCIYDALKVPEEYKGPLHSEFHRMVEKLYNRGMRGGHTSTAPNYNLEDLVREHLGWQWAIEHGQSQILNHFEDEYKWYDLRLSVLSYRMSYAKMKLLSWIFKNPYRKVNNNV